MKKEKEKMQDTDNQGYSCPVANTIQLIGGKYKALILWHLMDEVARFSKLRRLVPQATPKMLTQQLRELERDGLVVRTVYPVVPPKVEYTLTEKGSSLRPVLVSMYDWGEGQLESEGLRPNCGMKTSGECCGRQKGAAGKNRNAKVRNENIGIG